MTIYICLILMTFMGSIASLFLKRASGSDGIKNMILNPNLYIGGMLYLFAQLLRLCAQGVVVKAGNLGCNWARTAVEMVNLYKQIGK